MCPVCGAPSASDTDVERQEGWAMCDLGHYPFTRGIEGRYIRRHTLFARIPGSRDSSASPPPIPQVVSSSRSPESLPDLLEWDSDGFLGDIDSDDKSPLEAFFKSSEARRWIERQEQEAVALRAAALCSQGSFPASSDAGEEPSSSTGGGEWGHPFGDGDLEVGAGAGAGDVGSRRVGVSGLCVPPSDDEVELLLLFALSSQAPLSPVFE